MDFIIRRKIFISMLFIGLTLLGIVSYKQLPVELIPSTQLPYLFVQVSSTSQVDPKYTENQAIIPIEGAIGTLKGVDKIESTISQQGGYIQISYKQNTDLKYAYLKLEEKVEEVRNKIPSDFYVQAMRFNLESFNNMIMTLQVKGSGGVDRIRQIVDNDIYDRLSNIDGIANIDVSGGREKTLEIIMDEEVGLAHGITPATLRNVIAQNNTPRTFAGKLVEDNQTMFVNISSDYSAISEIENLVINEEANIKLSDVAEIRFGYRSEDSYSRVDGKESVLINITRDTQSNMIDLSHRILDEIHNLNTKLASKDIEIDVQSNNAETMEKNIDKVIRLAIAGGLIAIFILWIFLGNIRLVIAIGLAIPVSVYVSFNLFYAFGITVNMLTLLGMALAIGMLLDNSVVVLENIYRLVSEGKDIDTAVKQGTKEITRSIIAATLTTIMVFLPFAFSRSFEIATIGKHIGISIISTLSISLIVALLLIPMITHAFLSRNKKAQKANFSAIAFNNRLMQVYRVLLKTCMRKPAQTAMAALGVFFVVLLISLSISFLRNEEPELEDLVLYVTMPSGTTLENTDLVIADAESRLEELKEKKTISSQIYEEEAQITITLKEDFKKIRNSSIPKIKEEILRSMNSLRPASFSWDPPPSSQRFRGNAGGGGGGGNFGGMEQMLGLGQTSERIYIKGENYDQLVSQADRVVYYLRQQQGIQSADVNLARPQPEVLLELDKHIMSVYNIQPAMVLSELQSFPSEISTGVDYKQGVENYNIMIRTETPVEREERNLDDLKSLPVYNADNAQFELNNISDFTITTGVPNIVRVNQAKQLVVEYSFITEIQDDKDLLTTARYEIESLLAGLPSPTGITMEIEHEQENLMDFKTLIPASLILIFMILASVFDSFTRPIVLLMSIPMATVGSMTAMFITGNSLLNPVALIGIIILIGIVVNNGIILLDYTSVLQKRGYRPSRALMMSGLARVRPILITSLTTIIALLPLAMSKGEYTSIIGAPFAITIIGGLSISTLMTLVFIPTLNKGIQSAIRWIMSLDMSVLIMMFLLYILLGYTIIVNVDSVVWKIIDFILLIVLTPAAIYFVKNSLRKANEKVIDEGESLFIHIRNLVKIYDWDSRFMREWKSGLRLRKRFGLAKSYTSWNDFRYMFWKVPVLAFLIYFIYFFLESRFWFFTLPIALYLYLASMFSPLLKIAGYKHKTQNKKWTYRFIRLLYGLIFWFSPAMFLSLYYLKYKSLGLIIPVAFFWYLFILIKVTSEKIYREKINIIRLKGFRKLFYRFVMFIPIIGRKKVPFKALKGVSINIGNGMFGLLGPNGAGKSTLMKIICGTLEPSYGQITINGIDVKEKREELQGLIGYLPQEFGMYENLTAWEFLNYMAILKKIKDKKIREDRVRYVLEAVHMIKHKDEKLGSYSGGMKQRIGIAQILLHLPRILVVDEPTAGLDPKERIRFRNLLVELSKDRIVIFSTHIIEDIASSCNKVAVIQKGELKYLGEPVKMAKLGEGKIWMADMTINEFEKFKDNYVIIHHMRDGDNIRVRFMADEKPFEQAHNVKANLEDAYLCLLHE